MVCYGPNEGDGEEKERFWNEFNRIVDRVGIRYKWCAGKFEWMG